MIVTWLAAEGCVVIAALYRSVRYTFPGLRWNVMGSAATHTQMYYPKRMSAG